MVSATLALSFDDFFEDLYVENLAYVLGIDPARIKVVSVVAGSVVLKVAIGPTAAEAAALANPIAEEPFDTSNNMDAEVRKKILRAPPNFKRHAVKYYTGSCTFAIPQSREVWSLKTNENAPRQQLCVFRNDSQARRFVPLHALNTPKSAEI
eukprot:1189647-Prorocentrum_minimum.AAC.1